MRSRIVCAVVCATLASGCIPVFGKPETAIIDTFMAFLGAKGKPSTAGVAVPQAAQKLEAQLSVPVTVTIGGLSGAYDVTLGSFGQFTGTAKVVGQRGAKLKDDGSPELLAAVHAMLLEAHAQDVTVSEASAKISGKQTTGGVNKRYKGKIKFKGTIAAGADAGTSVKGKMSTKGDLED